MAIAYNVMKVFNDQKALVLALDDPAITELAKEIAFYSAMIDAALSDPDDDPEFQEFQEEFLQIFKTRQTELVETYQSLVNEQL